MTILKIKSIILITTLVLLICMPASATTYDDKYILLFRVGKNIINAIDISSEQDQKYPCRVTARLNLKTGRIGDVEFVNETSDPQMRLAILDALLSIGKVEVPSEYSEDGFVTFEMGFGSYNTSKIRYQFDRYKSSVEPRVNSSIFHSIPLEVLIKYPGVFTYDELVAPAHQRRLPLKYVSAQTVRELREPWINFFDEHPEATQDQILTLEKELDGRFKEKLLPFL